MRLSWAAFEWPVFRERYALTALGGLVVTGALFLMTKLTFWPFVQGNAQAVFREIQGTVSLSPFILLCVLVLFLAFLVLSGAPAIDLVGKWGLISAAEFCKDAAYVGTGVWIAFLVFGQFSLLTCLQNVFYLAAIAFVLHGTKAIVLAYTLPAAHPDSTSPTVRLVVASISGATLVGLYFWL
jgi:hypothetical protein